MLKIYRSEWLPLSLILVAFLLSSNVLADKNNFRSPKAPIGKSQTIVKVNLGDDFNNHSKLKAPILPVIKLPIKIDGNIRAYYFDKGFGNRTPDQRAFSLGGKLNVTTQKFFDNYLLGATLYTAQPLILNPRKPNLDASLPGTAVTALGQTYLEYNNKYVLARVGNQLIDTPWLNPSDTRMIPYTYQGASIYVTPSADLTITALRVNSFKSTNASRFTQTNAYYIENLGPYAILNNHTTTGAAALGGKFNHENLQTQLWLYNFYNYGKLAYGDVNYKFNRNAYIRPLLGAQAGYNWSDGHNLMESFGLGSVKSSVFGLLVGADVGESQLSIGWNLIPKRNSAYFRNGDIVSPYTSASTNDPLYTNSMIQGLIAKGAGTALKASIQSYFCEEHLVIKVSAAKYNTSPIPPTTETNIEGQYIFTTGIWKALSIKGRYGVLNGNPTYKRFAYGRLMLQYNFN